jgi:hypothetical protein
MILKMSLKPVVLVLMALLPYTVEQPDSPDKAQQSDSEAQPDDLGVLRAEVSKYKTWTRANPQPVLMDPVTAVDCASPGFRSGPHANKYILVYVNEVARSAMMTERYPKFPPGSIIVKEKLGEKSANALPELLTIMVKRNSGYDTGNGDWDYLVADGFVARFERPVNVKSCQTCHLRHRDTDYVSRQYLSESTREKLR